MNVFKERNAFHQWLLLNEMRTSGIVLWHALMDICNQVGRKPSFNVPNGTLMKLTGLSKRTLIEARAILVENNLIHYKKGKKGCAPVYEMVSFEKSLDQSSSQSGTQLRIQLDTQSRTQLNTQSGTQSRTQSTNETCPIHKDKVKEKRGGGDAREEVISVYRENFGNIKPLIQREIETWCEKVGEELVLEAITIAVKKGGRTFSYVEMLLKEWTDAKALTLAEVQKYEQNKSKKKPISSSPDSFHENKADLFSELLREEMSS